MRIAVLLLAFVALSALAAESKMEKDQRECKAFAAKAPAKHPAEIQKTQRDAFNKCMRGRSYAMPPIREK